MRSNQQFVAQIIPALSILTLVLCGLASALHYKKHPKPRASRQSWLHRHARIIIYITAVLINFGLWSIAAWVYSDTASALAGLTRNSGLVALFFLLVTLIPGLVNVYFPQARPTPVLLHARKALGLSTLFFTLQHLTLGFFVNLSGSIHIFSFLGLRLGLAVLAGLAAAILFSIMGLADYFSPKIGKWWKRLHRFIYLAAILVLVHVLLIGSHFTRPYSWQYISLTYITLTILLLEVTATYVMIWQKKEWRSPIWVVVGVLLLPIALFSIWLSYTLLNTHPSSTNNDATKVSVQVSFPKAQKYRIFFEYSGGGTVYVAPHTIEATP